MDIGINDNNYVSIGKKIRASQILNNNFASLDTAAGNGPADGKVERADLVAVINDRTGKFSKEEKIAAKFMLTTADQRKNTGVDMFQAAAGADSLLTQAEFQNYIGELYQRQAGGPPADPPADPVAANQTASMKGDPHVVDADGGKWDFMDPGTYNLLQDQGVELNAEIDGPEGATCIRKTGVTVGDKQVQIDADGSVQVDGQEVALADGAQIDLGNGNTLVRNGDSYTIETAEYSMKLDTNLTDGEGKKYLDVTISSKDAGVEADGVKPTGILGETFDADAEAQTDTKQAHETYKRDGLFAGGTEAPADNCGYDVNNPSAETNKKAVQKLEELRDKLDQAAGIGDQDGRISITDMQAALNDTSGKFTEEDKAAIRYMLEAKQNESGVTLWDAMDGAGGEVNLTDIRYAATQNLGPSALSNDSLSADGTRVPNNYGYDTNSPTADANTKSLEVLMAMKDKLDQAAGMDVDDGIIGLEDMQAALADTTGKFSEEEKAAIRYLLEAKQNGSGVTLWEALNGPDTKVDSGDIEVALQQNLDPNTLVDDGLHSDAA